MLFVGEALVGNEAVDQLVKFNQALADHSRTHERPRLIDGIVLTKFDTIDDKVSVLVAWCSSNAGGRRRLHDLHHGPADRVRGHGPDLHGPEEPERQRRREQPPEMSPIIYSYLTCIFNNSLVCPVEHHVVVCVHVPCVFVMQ